ncbi:hypothetical protein ACJX0J_006550, partial [Zea mays]
LCLDTLVFTLIHIGLFLLDNHGQRIIDQFSFTTHIYMHTTSNVRAVNNLELGHNDTFYKTKDSILNISISKYILHYSKPDLLIISYI